MVLTACVPLCVKHTSGMQRQQQTYTINHQGGSYLVSWGQSSGNMWAGTLTCDVHALRVWVGNLRRCGYKRVAWFNNMGRAIRYYQRRINEAHRWA